MTKTLLPLIAGLFLSTILKAQISIPNASPTANVSQAIGLGEVSVEYSRPSVKGRKIFGNLVPFGKVWRTGANKITSITLSEGMKVNNTPMEAGTYGLYTVPGEASWKIILNRNSEQWGAYEYDPIMDALSFEVQPIGLDKVAQHMNIYFDEFSPTSAFLVIAWELTAVKFKIEHDIKPQIHRQIQAEMSKNKPGVGSYFTAAEFYYQNDYKLEEALEWSQKALEADQKYWTYQLVARIAAKMGKCKQAIPAARASMKLAKEAGDDAYILLNQHSLMMCGAKIDN